MAEQAESLGGVAFGHVIEFGLARGNFYYYFKNKDESLCTVIALRDADGAALCAPPDTMDRNLTP